MSNRSDKEFLLDIFEACKRIRAFVKDMSYEDFLQDIKTQDAVIRNIEIIGEAVKNISEDFKIKHPEIEWRKISGMRDKLVHFYFGVNLEIVWDVAKNKVSDLIESASKLVKEFPSSD